MYELVEKKKEPIRRNNNYTGIPEQMKKKMEQNNRVLLDDVKVHYNSDKPKKLDALAYTKGNNIYLGVGQEHYLSHELGHVVQQKIGTVYADTQHKSGERLNTNVELERQADQIGNGESMRRRSSNSSIKNVVQRMSILEEITDIEISRKEAEKTGKLGIPVRGDRVRVGIPKIGRYKTEGWSILQVLREYFTEECINNIKLLEVAELNKKLKGLQQKKINESDFGIEASLIIEKSMEMTVEFQGFLERRIKEKRQIKKSRQREGIENLCDILERCEILFKQNIGSLRQAKLKNIENKGEYVRVSDIDPYFNYKKIAIYCVAHMGSKINRTSSTKDPGPHIAITVFGKRIYAANNTWNKPRNQTVEAMDMETLKDNIRVAIERIEKNDIRDIFTQKGDFFVKDAPFEARKESPQIHKTMLTKEEVEEIYEWIQKIKNYSIVIIDVPEQRQEEEGKNSHDPIHGEMSIMDYLQREARSPEEEYMLGFPKTTHEILRDRNAKLNRIKGGKRGKRRILQFGGTRIDCKKCHEHFEELRMAIEGNYIVSSQQTSKEYFPGTELGTHPKSKGYEKKARVVASELKIDFNFILEQLDCLKAKMEQISSERALRENDFEKDEIKLIEDLNKYLPDIKYYTPIANYYIAEQCQEIERRIIDITVIWLDRSE